MEKGDYKKIQIKIGEKIYIYRGLVLSVDDGFVSLRDIKAGIVRLRISEIVTEENFNPEGWQR